MNVHERKQEEKEMDAETIMNTLFPEKVIKCKYCGGNGYDIPCAYPSEGKDGCLRDYRLKEDSSCLAGQP